MAFISLVAIVVAMADTGGHTWQDRLAAIALGLLSWVACTMLANALVRPLLDRGLDPEHVQLVTSGALGALMGGAAILVANLHGSWSAVAAGAGWLTAGAVAGVAGLTALLSGLEREDAVGDEMRRALEREPAGRMAWQVMVWFLTGALFVVWVALLEGAVATAGAAVVLQAAVMAALALTSQRRLLV
ncbi:MAG: hypothetical protein ACQERF_06630 [Actinomycetota bacterium]